MQIFLDGKKTWIGLLLIALGYFGWGDLISADKLGQTFDLVTQLVGLAVSVYGNWKAHKKLAGLQCPDCKRRESIFIANNEL